MIASGGTFQIRVAHQKPCSTRRYSLEELHKWFVGEPPEEMCSHIVLCLDPERSTFVCLDCSFPSVLLQTQDQMQKCSGCIYISNTRMLMTEQSVLSRGVGHKLNVVIRGVEDLQAPMIMESVGMEGVCCNYYFIFSFPSPSPALKPLGPRLQSK